MGKTKLHNLHVYLGQDGLVTDTTDYTQVSRSLEHQIDKSIYCNVFYDCPDVLEEVNYERPSMVQYYRDIKDGKVEHV